MHLTEKVGFTCLAFLLDCISANNKPPDIPGRPIPGGLFLGAGISAPLSVVLYTLY